MPVYLEKRKDKKTGQIVDKEVDGKKQYYIRSYITDQFGNRKQITRHNKNWLGIDGKREATAEDNRLQMNTYQENLDINLDELFDLYLKHIKTKLKASSVRKNTDNYNLHIKPYLGYKQINSLTNKDILGFHNYLDKKLIVIRTDKQKRKRGNYPLSLAFKQSIHMTLSSILSFGCKYYNLKQNVARIVGNYQMPKGCKKRELNFLTVDEFDRFIQFEQNETYKDFFTILFFTGMRRGELLALKINNVNFEENIINICEAINPKNGILATFPKTNKSNRKIQMLNIVSSTLKKYSDNHITTIFGIENIKPTTLQRKCDRNCKLANIDKNIRIHDFRHSFASLCINKGVPIEIISNYLGHESISTTLDIYGHLYPDSQEKLTSVLEKFLETRPKARPKI